MQTDPYQHYTDEELLSQFCQGDAALFGALVRRYERELFGYLVRYLGDRDLADDVFQNTFLQLYTKAATYEPGRPVRPWLYTIATHQAIDALRRNGRRQVLSLDQAREEPKDGDLGSLLEMIQARGDSPLDAVVGSEQRELVRATVDRLPEFLKQVVVLAYYQGLKYREIAEILEVPVGTVKSRLHAALVKLQGWWSASPTPGEV